MKWGWAFLVPSAWWLFGEPICASTRGAVKIAEMGCEGGKLRLMATGLGGSQAPSLSNKVEDALLEFGQGALLDSLHRIGSEPGKGGDLLVSALVTGRKAGGRYGKPKLDAALLERRPWDNALVGHVQVLLDL